MPVFNGERFLEEALASILEQTWSEFEFVVVDDGSQDGTADILRGVMDARLRVVTQPNAGMAAALNAGLRISRGRYVARMDADDRSSPDRLARQVAFLDRHADVALVGSSYRLIDGDGACSGVMPMLVSPVAVARDLYTRSPFGHGTVMVRRDVLEQLDGYAGSWWPVDDYDLWRRLLVEYRGANLPEALYDYRLHEQNSSVAQQTLLSRRIRDELWVGAGPPRLRIRQFVAELAEHWAAGPELRMPLIWAYVDRHASLLRDAVQRERYDVARRLGPAAPLVVLVAATRFMRQLVRGLRPITRKMLANLSR